MLTYEEMHYVAAFSEYGTLTEVAEKYNISQPTITRTISIGSAAAIQLPDLVGKLSHAFLDKAISTEMKLPEDLLRDLNDHVYQLIVLAFDPTVEDRTHANQEKIDQNDKKQKDPGASGCPRTF